ncbi:MAG: nuclear transport factor 2 family protein [Actinobacteria bacterium]|nr:nuclear transport factor 2 family protein [Actinomycetota bacterium]
MTPAQTGLSAWHEVVAARDPELLDDLLAPDVEFHSPVLFRPVLGAELTKLYLSGAVQVLAATRFTYVREVVGEYDAVLEFEADVDDRIVNGVDIIRFDEQGRIIDFKVMIRPLSALLLVRDRMAALLSDVA